MKDPDGFRYSAQPTVTAQVRVSDGKLWSDYVTVTVNVQNVNDSPTDILLSSNTIIEKEPIGTTVGTLSTTDEDAGDSFTYSW